MELKVLLIKRDLHGIKLSPPFFLMKQSVVPYTCYSAWYLFLVLVSNINFPLIFYIEFFKIIPRMNIKYPIFYCTLLSPLPGLSFQLAFFIFPNIKKVEPIQFTIVETIASLISIRHFSFFSALTRVPQDILQQHCDN